MKVHWGVEVQLHQFLTSALDGGEWSASRPGRFSLRERNPDTHWSLGGPQGWSVHDGEQKNSQTLPALELPTIQPVAHR
jgi:hypothetical protein